MQANLKTYLPALLCAGTPVICFLIVRPYAEIGVDDEWSYIKSAQVLAQTGHIVYNGFATTMLGWQLYFGALFIKLFGFSFAAVRLSALIEAVATAFLLERTLVRAGINEWNATLATLTFVLSPVYLPLTVTFMTDVSGVLCIVLCLYMCLRALEAESRRSAILWICLAVLVNAVGGTARQIVWLGVLVMVPSTLWLLRRDRRVLVTGSLACIAGIGFVFAAMHWFARQPFSIPESLVPSNISLQSVNNVGHVVSGYCRSFVGWLIPVLLMFVGALWNRSRRMVAVIAAASLCYGLLIVAHQNEKSAAAYGAALDIASVGFYLLQAGATAMGFLSFVFCFPGRAQGRPILAPHQEDSSFSWQELCILLGPFTCAYMALLMPRTIQGLYFERYLLPLLTIGLLVLTRLYQERVRANLPVACAVLIVLVGAFSCPAIHDAFALRRGYEAAIDELRSSGVPTTAILGPWEFDGWTEVEKVGYVNDPGIRIPEGAYVPAPARDIPPGCDPFGYMAWTPAIKPVYIVSKDPIRCGGPAGFPPVTYRTWLAPHNRSIYVVKLPVSFND